MKKPNEFIKVELVIEPHIALLIGMYLHQTVQGSMEFHNMLTESGKMSVMEIGQNIVDQVALKGFDAGFKSSKIKSK
jgi:hypothetical protein